MLKSVIRRMNYSDILLLLCNGGTSIGNTRSGLQVMRNIRFGLSTDGVNNFGNMRSSHSTWPVTLCIFNLPSSLCMKRKYILMPLLIKGPKQLGNNIDVYLKPLIKEMLMMWNDGVEV